MKKIIALILSAVAVLGLCACSAGGGDKKDMAEVRYNEAVDAVKEAEKLLVHFYDNGEEKTLQIDSCKELEKNLSGTYEKASGKDGGKKILTITVGTQHEITFFDNGRAMIYYGFISVFEKDRYYYEVSLDEGFESLYNWCLENGTVPETEK